MENNVFTSAAATGSSSDQDAMRKLFEEAPISETDPFSRLFGKERVEGDSTDPAEREEQPAEEEVAAPDEEVPEPEDQPGMEQADSDNPLDNAMVDQDLKEAKPIFEKPAVFSYNGTTENIADPNMTFEELRVAKAGDFVALDDPKKVSWTVVYGKTRKTINDPKKDRIGAIKKSIEMASGFLAEVKADKEKKLCCAITPTIKVQTKGELAAYKGLFSTVEEAAASEKTICLIPDCKGKLFELRKTELGEFITLSGAHGDLGKIRAGFYPALPPVPSKILLKIVSFFRSLMCMEEFDGECMEAVVNIYWDTQEREYIAHVPKQTVAHASADTDISEGAPDPARYVHYADIHSHNNMEARFSPVDDRDELETRVYVVIGELDKLYPSMTARISNGGKFQEIPIEQVFEPLPLPDVDPSWTQQLAFRPRGIACEQETGRVRFMPYHLRRFLGGCMA